MTREQLETLAVQAGFYCEDGRLNDGAETAADVSLELRRFAALVAAAEREACARVCDELAAQDKLSNYYGVAARAIRARGKP